MKTLKLFIVLMLCSINSFAYIEFSADTTSGNLPLLVTFDYVYSGSEYRIVWDFGDGEPYGRTNPCMHPYTKAGVFTVTCYVGFIDGIDTTLIKEDYITVKDPNDAILETMFNKVMVYPNPTYSILNTSNIEDIDHYVICNSLGVEIVNASFKKNIDVSYLPRGVYYIIFIGRNKKYISKFIMNK